MNIKKVFEEKIKKLVIRAKNIKKRSIYCIAVGFILAVFSFFLNRESIYVRPYEIKRGSYGTQKTPYKISLDAENLAKSMEFSVSVSGRKYEKEEADEKFLEKMEKLKINILNENEDFEHINSKLSFANDLGDGIRASYTFNPMKVAEYYDKYDKKSKKRKKKKATSNEIDEFKYYVTYQNIIDGNGNVSNQDFKVNEFCTGILKYN